MNDRCQEHRIRCARVGPRELHYKCDKFTPKIRQWFLKTDGLTEQFRGFLYSKMIVNET